MQCLRGGISPQIAVARLLLAGEAPPAIRAQVLQLVASAGTQAAGLERATRDAASLAQLRGMIDRVTPIHSGSTTPDSVAAMFDQAVAASPEASVALYSLGDAATLDQATQEIVEWLQHQRLLASDLHVLDLGCGIGRFGLALSPLVRSVLGIDVSAAMLCEAARRCAGLGNTSFIRSAGRDLSMLRAGCFGLVLAVDSFPYLVQAELAERHVRDVASVLRPGGRLVVLNVSYRNDLERDRNDLARWSAASGLHLDLHQERAFRLWDGSAWILSRA